MSLFAYYRMGRKFRFALCFCVCVLFDRFVLFFFQFVILHSGTARKCEEVNCKGPQTNMPKAKSQFKINSQTQKKFLCYLLNFSDKYDKFVRSLKKKIREKFINS